MISSSLEEYLKTIYVLKKQGQDIKVTTIANRMNCTKPSVNKAIKNLKANENIKIPPYYISIFLSNIKLNVILVNLATRPKITAKG